MPTEFRRCPDCDAQADADAETCPNCGTDVSDVDVKKTASLPLGEYASRIPGIEPPGSDDATAEPEQQPGFIDRASNLPGIDKSNTTRRNALVGGAYAILGLGVIGAIAGVDEDDDGGGGDQDGDDTDESAGDTDTGDDQEGGDSPEIAFEDEWYGPVAEEPNPETFDPDRDMPTVTAWIEDTVDHLESVYVEMDPSDIDEWVAAGERATELDDRFLDEIEPLYGRIVDGEYIADGIPAWDIELARAIDDPEGGSLTEALLAVDNAAWTIEDEGEIQEYWVTNTAEEIQLALQGLEDADGYEYTVPEV